MIPPAGPRQYKVGSGFGQDHAQLDVDQLQMSAFMLIASNANDH
jgi:hypothetical protein